MSLQFVVAGTGRCGTGYIAALFHAAGIPCGHEEVFKEKPGLWERAAPRHGFINRCKEPLGRLKEEFRRRQVPVCGDASWLAVPRLKRFGGVKFLQLRHPIAVISSFTGTGFFSREQKTTQNRFAEVHFNVTGDDVLDAMRWWVHWNRMAAPHSDMIYKIEDLDVAVFARMLDLIGNSNDALARAKTAIESVPTNMYSARANTCNRKNLSWEDLPRGPEKKLLLEAAHEFGYERGV